MAKAESVMSPTAKRPLLQMRNITKRFGNIRALNGVDLDIYTGEIHALMGENGAGKSTLMKILSGAHKTTSGEITVDGQSMLIAGPRHAKELGISIIYQELSLAPNLTVAENMLLGREITHGGVLNRRAMSRACNEVLEELGVVFSVDDKVGTLSLAQQQQVEIARALLFDCRILVMDEPTTSLSSKECDSLFELIRRLRKQGMAIIYISHRMSEIYDLSDRVTVLRDGKYIGCIEREDLSEERLVQMMVGRDLSSFYEKDRDVEYSPGRKLLSITDIADDRKVHGVSLDVHAGEILGLAGIVGAGRTELARLIYGADKKTRGTIILEGRELDIQKPQDALEAGIVYLTEDRKHEGLFLDLSVNKNININAMGTDSHLFGILNSSKGDARTAAAIDDMQIAVSGPQVNVGSLSGGNQQKVLLARLLQNNPQVLILDEPTRGVDIGAKSEIYRIIEALAATGTGVIVISSELPELIGICDRIIIMREGIAAGEVGGDTGNPINSEGIIATATGSSRQQ